MYCFFLTIVFNYYVDKQHDIKKVKINHDFSWNIKKTLYHVAQKYKTKVLFLAHNIIYIYKI